MSHPVGRTRLPALALLLAMMAIPLAASARTNGQRVEPETAEATEESCTNWGPIVGACLGVMFGGALALWQIRGMRNRD